MNPFHPFPPYLAQKFLDRVDEERNVLENINRGISTAIIGNPHIGKTSLLKKIAEHQQFKKALHTASAWLTIEFFEAADAPEKFWQRVCEKAIASQPKITKPLKVFTNPVKYNPSVLFDVFEKLGAKGNRVIVFVDEFDKILDRPYLKTIDFIDPLQAFAQKTQGLCLVIASRKSIPELQESIPVFGSPFEANSFTLKSFDDVTVQELFANSGLLPDAIEEAKLLGGHHPFLLHLAGDLLWKVKDKPVRTHL
jgi:AAA+ ATPase superfamily predicted ATPase